MEEYLPSPFGRLRSCVFRQMEPRALIEEIQVDGPRNASIQEGGAPIDGESTVVRCLILSVLYMATFGRVMPLSL